MMRIFGLSVLVLSLAGCSSKEYPTIVPVQGKILFADGKPLPEGTRLVFHPASGHAGCVTGVTDGQGQFTVRHESGSAGAPVGKYTVQLAAPESDRDVFFKKVPKEYYEGTGSLVAQVEANMGDVNFRVKKQ